MPSPFEYRILLIILGAVFVSLPVALLLKWLLRHGSAPAAGTGDWVIPPPPPPVPEVSHGGGCAAAPWWEAGASMSGAGHAFPGRNAPMHAHWTWKDGIFAVILALLVSMVLGPFALGSRASGGSEGGAMPPIDFAAGIFISQLIFQGLVVAVIFAWLCGYRKYRAAEIFGLRRHGIFKSAGLALLWMVPAYFGIITISFLTLPLLQQATGIELKQQMLVEAAPGITDPLTRILLGVTLCAGAPIMEELIFRGVLFGNAARFVNQKYAIGVTAVFFAVVHNNLMSLIPLTLLGIVFAVVYQRTRSLLVPVMMHSIFNFTQFLLLLYGPKPGN